MRKHLIICILFVLALCPSMAQQNAPKVSTDSIFKALSAEFKKENTPKTPLRDSPYLTTASDTVKKAYERFLLFQMQNNQQNFEWNLVSSKIIFWMVLFLVFMGVVFSGIQFYKATLEKRRHSKNSEPNELHTQIEASLQGVKISSPVLGVIILTLSLAFFYLYLVYVYPIIQL